MNETITAGERASARADVSSASLRVLYIAGAGRSGSTVLDTVLGHHADVVGVGELVNLHQLGWKVGDVCACGEPSQQCSFWTRVQTEWQRLVPEATLDGYLALQDRMERFRWLGVRRWVRFLWEGLFPTSAGRAYLRQTAALFQAIATVSGRTTIVDSSKSPLRAAWLTRLTGIDLRLLHLVRDARAVVWSRAKSYKADIAAGITRDFRPKPTWLSVGYWLWINWLTLCVRWFCLRTSLELRYEDFVSDPATSLDRISEWSRLNFTETASALQRGEPIPPQHSIAGNRVRMSGPLRLKPDWEWVDRLPIADRRLCWIIAGALLKRFGYSHDNSPTADVRATLDPLPLSPSEADPSVWRSDRELAV